MKVLKIFLIIVVIFAAVAVGYFAEEISTFLKAIITDIRKPVVNVTFQLESPKDLKNASARVNNKRYPFEDGKIHLEMDNTEGLTLVYIFEAPYYKSLSDGKMSFEPGRQSVRIPALFEKIHVEKSKIIFKLDEYKNISDAVVTLDGKKYAFLNGRAEIELENPKGRTISYMLSASGYQSLSDSSFFLTKQMKYLTIPVKFKKILSAYNVRYNIQAIPPMSGVSVFLGETLIGQTDNNGRYQYNTSIKQEEGGILHFRFKKEGFIFDPAEEEIDVNQSIDGTTTITPRLDMIYTAGLIFKNRATGQPISDISIASEDNKFKGVSDRRGQILWKVTNPVYNQNLKFRITNGNVSAETMPNIIIDGNDSISTHEILCNMVFSAIVKVYDNMRNPIKDVSVSVNMNDRGKTNQEGFLVFPVEALNVPLRLKFSKPFYETLEQSFTPTQDEAELSITLRSTTAIIVVVDSISRQPVEFVDILKDGRVLGQTNNTGRVTIPVTLNNKIVLTFRPDQESGYKTRRKSILFLQNNETQTINLIPQPYNFVFKITNDANQPIRNATINYRNRKFTSNNSGLLTIEDYNPTFPLTLTIQHGLFSQNIRINKESGHREYERNVLISRRVNVDFISTGNTPEEETAEIKIYNHLNNLINEDIAPYTAELEPGDYKLVASAGDRTVERQIRIRGAGQEISIDMADPYWVLKDFYNKGQYAQVVQIYEAMYSDILEREYSVENDRTIFCDLNNILGKSYGFLNDNENAARFFSAQIDNDCVINDPIFYYNTATIFFNVGKWEEAVHYFQVAYTYRNYFPESVRAERSSDCRYYQASATLQIYEYNRSNQFGTPESRCRILEDATFYLEDFVGIATEYFLPMKNATNLQNQIYNAGLNEGCLQ